MKRLPGLLLALTLAALGGAFVARAQEEPTPQPQPPAAPADEAPAAPGDEAPAAPGDEAPAAPGDEAPAAPGDEAPAAPGDEAPAAPGDEAPAAPGDEQPAAPGDEQPAAPGDEAPAAPGDEQPAAPGDEQPVVPGRPPADSGDASDLMLGKGSATVERNFEAAQKNKVPLRAKLNGGERSPLWTQDTVIMGESSQAVAEFGGSKVTLFEHTTFRVKQVAEATSVVEILGIELELERGTVIEAAFGSLKLSVNNGTATARNTGSTPQKLELSWTDASGNSFSASVDFPPAPADGSPAPALQAAPGGAVSVPAGSPPVQVSVQVSPPGGGPPVTVKLDVQPGQSLGDAAGLPPGASLDGLGGALQSKAAAEQGGGEGGGGGSDGGEGGEGDGGGGDDGADGGGADGGGADGGGGGTAGGGGTGTVNPTQQVTTNTGGNPPIQGTEINTDNPADAVQPNPGTGVQPVSPGL